MGFTTKLDYSNNRQIKQHIETITTLSGGTTFGTSFENLRKGANTLTSGITEDLSGGISTFSGNNNTTNFNWFDSRMSLGEPSLSAITNEFDSQDVLPIFKSTSSVVIDGNIVNTSFSGITFDIIPLDFFDLGGGNYSGTVSSSYCDILSASTAEFTGRTIWVDVSGITRTEKLIISNNPQIGYVLTCVNSEGMAIWAPNGGSSSGNTEYAKTYLETQTILAEDNNIELNYNGTIDSSIGGGVTIIRGEEEPTTLIINEDGSWISNVNIFSEGFVIPEFTPTSTQDISGIVGNIVQDDNYIYIKREGGWKRTPKLEEF
jgi:hypothetical protein